LILRYFSLDEQTRLVREGSRLLVEAGAAEVNAFRAGSFAFNRDTLHALEANGIPFDTSYNASMFGPDSGVLAGQVATTPFACDGIYEYPMTVFQDGSRALRHAQLTACSYKELEGLLWNALELGYPSFVLLSHNFELLNQRQDRPDWIVVKRFNKLCEFLARNKDSFNVRGFHGLKPKVALEQQAPLRSTRWKRIGRTFEQIYRRVYR
jgi:hypothetical protein